VDVILGPVHGGCAGAVANFLTPSKTPNIMFMAKSIGSLRLGGGNIFMPFGTMEGTGYYIGLYGYDKLGYKTVTTICEDFVTGQEIVGGAANAFQAKGGKIVQKQAVKPGNMDFSPYLSAMQQADSVFFWFTPMLASRFVTQYYSSGLKMPLLIPGSSVLFPKTLTDIGEKTAGMIGSSPYTNLIDTPLNKSYVEGFVKKFGFPPVTESGSADVSLTLYVEAVKATNGDTSSAKIIEALHKIKVTAPSGTYSFNTEGLGIGDLYITKVTKQISGYDWSVIDKYSQIPIDAVK
jgi:branched-chain amino acid transport system substrate-binding protein